MTRKTSGTLWLTFGLLVAGIWIAAYLRLTPRLVHPYFMAMLAVVSLIIGAVKVSPSGE